MEKSIDIVYNITKGNTTFTVKKSYNKCLTCKGNCRSERAYCYKCDPESITKRKAYQKKYRESENGRMVLKRCMERYNKSEKEARELLAKKNNDIKNKIDELTDVDPIIDYSTDCNSVDGDNE